MPPGRLASIGARSWSWRMVTKLTVYSSSSHERSSAISKSIVIGVVSFDAFAMTVLLWCSPRPDGERAWDVTYESTWPSVMGRSPHLRASRRELPTCTLRAWGSPRRLAPVRLAELVASLSLGIDLGFGQPMEHVLRQCLIALRLGEQLGLDETERETIYYTALLVNVGCHSDAHEQAKWFGDDIALKATKYEHEPFSVRDVIGMVRLIGSGSAPLHRFRTGLEFAISAIAR